MDTQIIEIARENFKNGLALIEKMQKSFEQWKVIDGYPNYSVSTYGNVRNEDTGKLLKGCLNGDGYYIVGSYKDGKSMTTFELYTPNAWNTSQ